MASEAKCNVTSNVSIAVIGVAPSEEISMTHTDWLYVLAMRRDRRQSSLQRPRQSCLVRTLLGTKLPLRNIGY